MIEGLVKPVFAIDFDGTITTHGKGYTGPEVEDPPLKGALDWLTALTPAVQIVLFSARAETDENIQGMIDWLNKYGFGEVPLTITSKKPPTAFAIFDDIGWHYDGGAYPPVADVLAFKPWWKGQPDDLPSLDTGTAAAAVESLAARASAADDTVTETVVRTAEFVGGEMHDLDKRAKTPTSLAGKLANVMQEKGLELAAAAADVKDSLRYTVLFDAADYSTGTALTLDQLERGAGLTVVRLRNYWLDEPIARYPVGAYVGVNAVLKTENGFLFEVQFHTPQSANVQAINWDFYKLIRSGGPDVDVAELANQMRENNAMLETPPLADALDSFGVALLAAVARPLGTTEGNIPPAVHYRPGKTGESWDQSCATCSFYGAGMYGRCGMFDAPVDPDYVCDEWAKGQPVGTTNIPEWNPEPEAINVSLTAALPSSAEPASDEEVAHHNELLNLGYRRIDELESKLADVLEPILVNSGVEAARSFRARATDHLTAAGDGQNPPDPKWSAPSADELINVAALVAQLRGKTDPIREAAVREQMTATLKAAGINFDVNNPLVAKALATTGAHITSIADTTRLNVMKIITASHEQGLSIPDTATAIQAGMKQASRVRATMIARTELAGAVHAGSLAATQIVAEATGKTYDKKWLTAPGARYPRHEDYMGLDGQTQPLDGLFDVGEAQLQFPGDPNGPPGEVINCRCTLVYQAPQEQEPEPAPESPAELTPAPGPPPGDTVSVGTGPFVPPEMVAKIDQLGLDQPLENLTPTTAIGRDVYATANNTQALYTVAGQWTPERRALHDEIIARHFVGKVATGEKPTAYFTAGGGASGKSAAVFDVNGRDVGLEELKQRSDVVEINPDIVKEMLPEYKQLRDAGDAYAASGVHEESSILAAEVTAEAQRRGLSTIIDTTGSSGKFVGKLKAAADAGYDVQATMFSIPTNEAIVRSMVRGDRSGRYVALQALKSAHAGASQQLALWKDSDFVKEWRVYDNTSRPPELVASGGGGKTPNIIDRSKWDAILAKANEQPGGR